MKASRRTFTRLCAAACVIAPNGVGATQDHELPDYKPALQVSGTIHLCGSPQMGDLLELYEEGFAKLQPGVRFESDLKSTLTAVPSVYGGRAEIGLLGREIWPTEVQAFESIAGHSPTLIDVATGSYDVPKATFALMIFVPKGNPISSISTEQLGRVFAASSRPIRTWGELGLKGDWAERSIHLYGFAVDNDKSQIFSQLIFAKGERWNPGLRESSNGAGPNGVDAGELIIQAVAKDQDAIGISNIHYANSEVKMLALSTRERQAPIAPTRESVADRTYPLTRAVYMVVNNGRDHPPSAAVIEFLRYVLSRQGKQAVVQEGDYLPLTPEMALRQLQQLPRLSR